MPWRSPRSGAALRFDGRHSLAADGERWPVIDGIPFLRGGRDVLVAACLDALDAGRTDDATALLLQDRDDWAPGPGPDFAACLNVVTRRDSLNFRAAMELLCFGPVADYLAHRWSDPTFLSGLALAEAHWRGRARVLELACGTGAFLRAFAPHATTVIGADVVFAKLWLARHFVSPGAALVCFDAAASWPVADDAVDVVFCHDALYFLPDKHAVARSMRRAAGPDGALLIGHAHNAEVDNHSAGAPLTPSGYAALFDAPVLYDDAELTAALLARRAPRPATPEGLAGAAAVALASGAGAPQTLRGTLDMPAADAILRRNPMYAGEAPSRRCFPSPRYEAEYGPLATYPDSVDAPARVRAADADEALVRHRVLLDLPDRW